MARTVPRYPSPPDDVCDTMEEVDAYYADMEDAYNDMRDEWPERGDE